MMRKTMIAALLLAAMPWMVNAQVEKQVEVTKAYVPSLESATKLVINPDMTDTTRMRPEIDYTITPLSLQTSLTTRPIQPAKVTYWEFNRPKPFYLKAGAGYPLNSVLDFYAATQNPGTGYVVGYVNHVGRYAKIGNDFGVENPSTRMLNRIGAAAGKYFGKRTLEGDFSYENRLYHRYGAYAATEQGHAAGSIYTPGSRVDFGDARASLRFGDDFQNLTRTNFEVAIAGGYFASYPELDEQLLSSLGGVHRGRSHQASLGGHAKVARGFGRHRLAAQAGYEWLDGGKALEGYGQRQLHAALRYGYEGGVVCFEAGADYYNDAVGNAKVKNYFIPFLRADFNLGTRGLIPFLEIDGGVYDNSYRSLTRQNPYYGYAGWGDKSSVDYNGRFGIGGRLWRDRFTYRVYAGLAIRDNHAYWSLFSNYAGLLVNDAQQCSFARQTVTSFNGEAEWRPVSPLLVSLGVHGYLYNDDTKLKNGSPSFDGNIGIRYEGRKFSFGVSALLQSERRWSLFTSDGLAGSAESIHEHFTAPFGADLRVDFDWKVSRSVSLFAEGRNLANRKLYEFALYPEYGANFTVGVKAVF